MSNPYHELFNAPGSIAFSMTGLIARIPLPMIGIGIMTMLSQLYDSYSLAGAVAATFVLTYALMSPQVSRLVDRYGQRHVLPIAAVTSVIGISIVLLSSWQLAPDWTLFIGAFLAGFMPSMSAMVRARWTMIYRGQSSLQTAYSLETVLDEVTFIAGPPLSIGLSVAWFPQAGLLVAVGLLLVGVIIFTLLHSTEPQVALQKDVHKKAASVIQQTHLRLLTLLMMAMGVIVGTIDIVSIAFAEQLEKPTTAGFVLAAYAIGSCLAGFLFGMLKLDAPLYRLLLLGGLATSATTLPLLFVNSIPALAGTVFVAGLFFAPTMIVSMSLVQRIVPENRLTESMTWLLAGLNIGVALGAALSGQVVDIGDAQDGFNISLCAGIAVLIIALWGFLRIRSNS